MVRFLIRRLALGLLVLWLITVAVFALFFVAPNNVARTLAGRQATPETVAAISHRLGLDQPLWKQYLDFVGNALHGDLGFDYYYQVPVTTILGAALPITLSLVLGAALHLAGAGCLQRGHLGDPPALVHRPVADRVQPVLLLHADVPARHPAALLPVLPADPGRAHGLPRRRLRARSAGASAGGPSTWSCRGSRWRWSRPRRTPGSPAPRCSTCSARTTSARPGPRASASDGWSLRHGLRAP